MPNFAQGKIYTLRCKTDDTLIYVGSTTQSLAVRMSGHRRSSMKSGLELYKQFKNWENYYIELYEDYPCERVEQLRKREGEVRRNIISLTI